MSAFPGSPRLVRGGLVLVEPESGKVRRIITLQYNPDTLSRTLQVQGVGGEGGDRSEALRLKGPAIETYKVEVELDATDDMEKPEQHPTTVEFGIHPQLAALESIVYPKAADLTSTDELASFGTIEISPPESLLTLFVWSRERIVPVRITAFSVTEEAFDPSLHPIRAKVSLELRVLSVDDVGFGHRGGSLFLAYLKNKERLSKKFAEGAADDLGLEAIP